MSKVVTLEYDAEANAFRPTEPVEGIADHQKFHATLAPVPDEEERSWLQYSGIMDEERGADFARAINELFPPWTGEDD
jgi:hypothetical protein